MSHNVRLNNIKFKDIGILERAVNELKAEGHNIEFRTGPVDIRGWHGRKTSVAAAILCASDRYDIGFEMNADGEYIPVAESGFTGGLNPKSGSIGVDGKACALHGGVVALGQLQQRYTVIAIERNAGRNGMMTRRIKDAATGQIHIEASK